MTNVERSEVDLDLDQIEPSASQVLSKQLPEIRQRLGLSAQAFAERAREAGLKFDRGTVSKIENGQRGISLDEALAIAAALDVAPVHLFLPREDDAKVQVAPNVTVEAEQARLWFRGGRPLPDGDDQTYRTEVPKSEWQQRSGRLNNAEEFYERCRRRFRVARERMRILGDRLGELDESIARKSSPFTAGYSFTQTLVNGDPDREERDRLTKMYDAALLEVAEAQVDLDDAKADLRQIRAEEGAS